MAYDVNVLNAAWRQMQGHLTGTGFDATPEIIRPRLILSVEGMEKSGKTHFAMTAPGPVAYQSIDIGTEGVVQKFTGKPMMTANYAIPSSLDKGNPALVMQAVSVIWANFVRDYKAALFSGARTIVWDTATEVWEFCRMARLGKLTQIMPQQYGPVNAEFRDLVRLAFESNCNLIMLHKAKDEYETLQTAQGERSRRTGQKKRAGFSEIGFLVQATLKTRYYPRNPQQPPVDPATGRPTYGFVVEVMESRMNPDAMGTMWPGADFPFIASLLCPQLTAANPQVWY